MALAEEEAWNVELIGEGKSVEWLKILHPPENNAYRRADDANLVVMIQWGDCRMLLAGDLSREGMIALSNRYPDLRADILVLNRPKDGISPNVYWMDTLEPRLILVTGITPDRKDRWVKELRQHTFLSNPTIWDTGTQGFVGLKDGQVGIRAIPSQGSPIIIHPNDTESSPPAPPTYGLLGSTMSSL